MYIKEKTGNIRIMEREESSGSDRIQNSWLKAFPAAHRHVTKNFNAKIEEPEKVVTG